MALMTDCVSVVQSLSQREKNSILHVLQRDEQLRKGQEQKISDLKREISAIRMCSVLRAGDDQSKICLRCRAEMGMLFNRGALCPSCKYKVCRGCQEVMFNGSWLCKLCYKQRQLKWLTGEWAASFEQNPLRKWASGSDLVKSSFQLVPGTTGINIDETPSQPDTSAKGRKVSRNGMGGPEHGRTRVEVPKEGDQLKLSELFNVLRVKKPEEVPVQETQVRRVVTSRKYSESDSDSSSNSDVDVRSTSTAPSVTESELDRRRLDSPRIVESPPPQIVESPLETESPWRPSQGLRVKSPGAQEQAEYRPIPSPRSPKPAVRRKVKSENVEQVQQLPSVKPRTKHSSYSKPNQELREVEEPVAMSRSMEVQSSGKIAYTDSDMSSSVHSDLSVHVAKTRESLDRKHEVEKSKSQVSLDRPDTEPGQDVIVKEKSKEKLRRQSTESSQARREKVTADTQHTAEVDKRQRHSSDRASENNIGADIQVKKSTSKSEISVKSHTSDETLQAESVHLDQGQEEADRKSFDNSSVKSFGEKSKGALLLQKDESNQCLPMPRAGSPYSVSMDSLPSSHPSPSLLRSSFSSNAESSDTDSINRLCAENIPEKSSSPAKSEDDFVVEQISKVHFKRVSKKAGQLGILAKHAKSPNKNLTDDNDLEVVEQGETQSRDRLGVRGEEGGPLYSCMSEHSQKYCDNDNVFNENQPEAISEVCIQEQRNRTQAVPSVTDMLIKKLEDMERKGSAYSSTGSKSGPELSWVNEYEVDNDTLNIEITHTKRKPRLFISSVASEGDRQPSEVDSIEDMIDTMAKGALGSSRKTSEADSEFGLNLTPISPFPSDLYKKRSGNYNRFAYVSDDNLELDSADDIEDFDEKVDDHWKETSENHTEDAKLSPQKKELQVMSSLERLLHQQGDLVDGSEGKVELEKEYENALMLTSSTGTGDGLQSNVLLEDTLEVTKGKSTPFGNNDQKSDFRIPRKQPLSQKSSLDVLLQQQPELDRNLENVEIDEELLANIESKFLETIISDQSNSALQKESEFLGVQLKILGFQSSASGSQDTDQNLDEIDALAGEAKEYLDRSDSSFDPESFPNYSNLPCIACLKAQDHGSAETSDSDMLSVIEEVDESGNTSEEVAASERDKEIEDSFTAESSKEIASDLQENIENAEKEVNKETDQGKVVRKTEKEKKHKKDVDSKRSPVRKNEKFKKIHDHWKAVEKNESDILDIDELDNDSINVTAEKTEAADVYIKENDLVKESSKNTVNIPCKEVEERSYKSIAGHSLSQMSVETPVSSNTASSSNSSPMNRSYCTESIIDSSTSCHSIEDITLENSIHAVSSSEGRSEENKNYVNRDVKVETGLSENKEKVDTVTVPEVDTGMHDLACQSISSLSAESFDRMLESRVCQSISEGHGELQYSVPEDSEVCYSIDEKSLAGLDDVFEDSANKVISDGKIEVPTSIIDSEESKDLEKWKLVSDNLKEQIKALHLSEKQAQFKSSVEIHLDKVGRVTPPGSVSGDSDIFRPPSRPPRTKVKTASSSSPSIPSSPDSSSGKAHVYINFPLTERIPGSRDSPQTISECLSQDDSGNVSGGSQGTTPEHRRTDSSYSQSSIPSTLSTVTDDDEDIDRAVARVKRQVAGTRDTSNLLSVFGDSRESLASYYSDAGDIAHSTIPVTGEILFSLNYNYKTSMLEVGIKQCRDIAMADSRRRRSDPYVKTYLLPDRTRGGKRKTKVKKHTVNPTFDETLKYSITKSELENRTLWVTVWHNDRFGRNIFLGEVTINFDYYKFEDPFPRWYPLQERMDAPPASMLVYKGDLSLSIRFVAADKLGASPATATGKHKKEQGVGRGQLQVKVKEARNLTAVKSNGFSDPFCKGYLLPERHKSSKQKTAVIKKDCNPVWNHTFVFEDVTLAELRERCLDLTVWDYEKLASNDFLGGVRLNLGTGLSQGKPVDWMDARGEEMSMWQAMLDRPNVWIDGALILRPNMDKRKF